MVLESGHRNGNTHVGVAGGKGSVSKRAESRKDGRLAVEESVFALWQKHSEREFW